MSPRHPHPSIRATSGFLAAVVLLQGCYTNRIGVRPLPLAPTDSTIVVTKPAKVQLLDGEVVYFPNGLSLTPSALQGDGTRYGLTLTAADRVTTLSRDSLAAVTWYTTEVDPTVTGGFLVMAALIPIIVLALVVYPALP